MAAAREACKHMTGTLNLVDGQQHHDGNPISLISVTTSRNALRQLNPLARALVVQLFGPIVRIILDADSVWMRLMLFVDVLRLYQYV